MFDNGYRVVYSGSHCSPDPEAEEACKYVFNDLRDIKHNYIKLGFHLDELKRLKIDSKLGYYSFYDFCLDNFNMDKSSVSRCLNVFYAFAEKDSDSLSRKMWIDDKYKDYSYSQLCEMVSISDEKLLKQIKPDMSVMDIRELKKSNSKVATSQPLKNHHIFDFFDLICEFVSLMKKLFLKNNISFSHVSYSDRTINFTIDKLPGVATNYIPAGDYMIRIMKVKSKKNDESED